MSKNSRGGIGTGCDADTIAAREENHGSMVAAFSSANERRTCIASLHHRNCAKLFNIAHARRVISSWNSGKYHPASCRMIVTPMRYLVYSGEFVAARIVRSTLEWASRKFRESSDQMTKSQA